MLPAISFSRSLGLKNKLNASFAPVLLPTLFTVATKLIGVKPPINCPVISAPTLSGNNCCAVAAPTPADVAMPASLDKNCKGFCALVATPAPIGKLIPTSSPIRPMIAVAALDLSYSVLIPIALNILFKD